MSDAGAVFSLGESLVERPMATTVVCKFAQAFEWKSVVLKLLFPASCVEVFPILPRAAVDIQ